MGFASKMRRIANLSADRQVHALRNLVSGRAGRDRLKSQQFALWKSEWNEQYGASKLSLPDVLIDLNPRQQIYALARSIRAAIKESLESGRGMGARTTVAPATHEHRRRMQSAPTRPRTGDFKERYPGGPSKGGSGFGYDSGYLADNLKVRKLRGRKPRGVDPSDVVIEDIAYAISPPKERAKAVAIQYNKREPLIALTQRDVDRGLQMIIDKVIKVRAPRKK